MKKLIIYLFTATGNTAIIANFYKEFLTTYSVTIHRILMKDKAYLPYPSPLDYDLIGFAYPIHAFNCPKVMFNFALLLPNVEYKEAIILKSSGEGLKLNNYSSQRLMRRMEKKGYHFINETHYVMPHNLTVRHTPAMVKTEYLYARSFSKAVCKGLDNKVSNKPAVNNSPLLKGIKRLKGWFCPILRIEWWYARFQSRFMKVNTNKCIKCNTCIRVCPLSNITIKNGKYKFGNNCALCAACVFNCPKNAISIGLLNGIKINGSYKIEETSKDTHLPFPFYNYTSSSAIKVLYKKYYDNIDKFLQETGEPLPKG